MIESHVVCSCMHVVLLGSDKWQVDCHPHHPLDKDNGQELNSKKKSTQLHLT